MYLIRNFVSEKTFVFFLQFAQYLLVGGLAFVVDYGVFYSSYQSGFDYRVATVLGFIGGLICNYLLCVFWIWRGTKATTVKDMLVFTLIGLIGLALTLVLMVVTVEYLGIDPVIAKIIVSAAVLFWNFVMRRAFVFFR